MRLFISLVLLAASTSALAQMGPISRARQVTASYNLDLVPSPGGKRAVLIKIVGGC